MIGIESHGSYNVDHSLDRMSKMDIYYFLDQYGSVGEAALRNATPIDTGRTAEEWTYSIIRQNGSPSIVWYNNNVTANGTPVAILIQYGHGTGTGGYVEGRDFINPAIQPLFDQIAEDLWKGVTDA